MLVRSRAPLRLGFGGGGSDLSPYCDLHGGYVLNATIDRYAYATLEPRLDAAVRFVATDREATWQGPAEDLGTPRGELALHRGVYNRIVREFNAGRPLPLTVTTMADAPPGSGLGSSSTLVVAMIKAFVELLNLPLGEYDIAHLAFEVERRDVGLSGGRQDQYAATFGGVNFMEFYAGERVVVNPLRIKNWILAELEASIVLFYTGVSRASASIIDEQTRNIATPRATALEATHRMKREALHMKESLLRGDLRGFFAAINACWEAKKETAQGISNAGLEAVYRCAMEAGARGGKISGAGGGGVMMFFADPEQRMQLSRALERCGTGQVLPCHFTPYGTQGWKIV
jgi:D-glycero-alpha-D-manno-heptose-7-phosphate kinase